MYSDNNSLLDHDVSKQSIYCKSPWSLVIKCVGHLRACHSKSQLDTKVVIVLPDWTKSKAITKELKLIKQLTNGGKVLMRTSPTRTYDPRDLIPSTWVINYRLINANTHLLSPMLTTNVSVLKPNIVTSNLETNATIEYAADKHLSTTTILVIMDSYELEALMRFTNKSIHLNGLSMP